MQHNFTKEVDQIEFFRIIGPMDVNPCHLNTDFVEWKDRQGKVIAISIPSWKNYYTNGKLTKQQYWIANA
jgi:hypothetical protein